MILKSTMAWPTFSQHTHTYTQTRTAVVWGCCWMAGELCCLNGKMPLTYVHPPTGALRACVGSSSVGECSSLSCCSTGHFSQIFIFSVFAWLRGCFTEPQNLNERSRAIASAFYSKTPQWPGCKRWKLCVCVCLFCFFNTAVYLISKLFAHINRIMHKSVMGWYLTIWCLVHLDQDCFSLFFLHISLKLNRLCTESNLQMKP